jgi:tetratricopeptide (TPR) repeat protein
MALVELDLIGFLPDPVKQRLFSALIDFLVDQAGKVVGGQIADTLRKLRSDADFQDAFDQALQRAVRRFVDQYAEVDREVLVALMRRPDRFWQAKPVREALGEMIRRPGTYLEPERKAIEQSFADILPKFEPERVNRAVAHFLSLLAEEVMVIPQLQPVYGVQLQKLTLDQGRAMVTALRDLQADQRQAMMALLDVVSRPLELPEASTLTLPEPPKVYHNLPNPDYVRFVGREEELARVHELLSPTSRAWVVTIDGIGGIGKSALALEVAHRYLRDYDRLPAEARFQAIIWTSAKASVLTADGIAPRRQIIRTLDDIYTTIAVTLEREDITRARQEEQDKVVTKALTRQRTLLIVDNLETVDDERVNAFLRELPAPTKAVVTTRHRLDVAYPVRLTGMPREDGLILIVQECQKKSVTLADVEKEKLFDRTGGVPLAIVWSVAQMGYGYGVDAVMGRLGQPSSDIARFCFEGTVERIRDADAHRLLMALAVFATDASREALGYVADLSELDRDDGLAELEKLSLINKTGSRFSVLPMTRQFALANLALQARLESNLRERQAEYYRSFISNYKLSSDSLNWIKQEHSNIAALLQVLISLGQYQVVIDIFNHYYPFLWRQGHWTQGTQLAQQVLDWALVNKNVSLQAKCNHWLGRLYLYQRQYGKAEKQLLSAAEQYSTTDWQWISVQTYFAQVLLRQGRFSEAHRTLEGALPIALGRQDYRGAIRLYNTFAEIELSRPEPDLGSALEYVEIGYALAQGRNEQTTVLGKNFYLRGVIERLRGNLELAEEWVTKYIEIADKEGFVQEKAQGLLERAQIAEEQHRVEKAIDTAKYALQTFDRLGMREEMNECEALLARNLQKL